MNEMSDKSKQDLCGSPSRDRFKHLHKKLSGQLYACDLDFVLVAKYPYRIVAFLDYKGRWEPLTFTEVIAYNDLLSIAPVFVVKGGTPETGPFEVWQFWGGDPTPQPPIYDLTLIRQCATWRDLEEWEKQLRQESWSQTAQAGPCKDFKPKGAEPIDELSREIRPTVAIYQLEEGI